MPCRDTAQRFKRVDMALQERFLPAGRVHPVDRFPGVRKPIHEHVALGLDAFEDDPDLAEIDLRFGARGVFLRDEHLNPPTGLQINLGTADPHVIPDRGIGQTCRAVLIDQAREDPCRGMPLLARRVQVRT